jgi:hypothetical protein
VIGGGSRSRGIAVGGLSGALSIAAHGAAGGALTLPAALLLVLAVSAVGAVAAGPFGDTAQRLCAVLAAGQLAGHVVLSLRPHLPHAPTQAGGSGASFLATHALAVIGCVLLLRVAERLVHAVATSVRAMIAAAAELPLPWTAPRVAVVADRATPLASAALLASTLSRRGPPSFA